MPDDWDATIYRQRAEAWAQRAALLPEGDPQVAIYLDIAEGYEKLARLIEDRSSNGASPKIGLADSDSRGQLLNRSAARAVEEQMRLAADSKALTAAALRLQNQSTDLCSQSAALQSLRGLSTMMLME